jgi:2-oxo-4-hydroxy-4-carboxy-5-ureidoimidazoline decarboxylase
MTIMDFDQMPAEEKRIKLLKCCGSTTWVSKMLAAPPAEDLIDLFENAEQKWYECSPDDWREAFDHHPQIGNVNSAKKTNEGTVAWAKNEQAGAGNATDEIKKQLAEGNLLYKEKFGYIFIINATGKTAAEMLAALQQRFQNNALEEIEIAAAEQLAITKIRLEKLLQET